MNAGKIEEEWLCNFSKEERLDILEAKLSEEQIEDVEKSICI